MDDEELTPWVTSEVLDRCQEIWGREGDLEPVIAYLRRGGYGQVETMTALVKMGAVGLGEAKRAVVLSPTWRDTWAEVKAKEKLLDDVVDQMAAEGAEVIREGGQVKVSLDLRKR